jgi:hypothetical protein
MRWRKSSYSVGNSDCVELAAADDSVFVRNSNHPDRGTLTLHGGAMAAFVAACRAGDLDDLSST